MHIVRLEAYGTVGSVNSRYAYLDHPGVIAFAHRGGAGDWPENTLHAFQYSIDLGYRYLETDVHVSADGVLFAFHDAHLARVTNANAWIGELTASEIDDVVVEGCARVPRLEEILAAWPEIRLNIDPKSDAAVLPLIDSIRRHRAIDRVCVGSFSDRRIALCRAELGPGLCTSMGRVEAAALRSASLGLGGVDRLDAPCAQLPPTVLSRPVIDRRLVETAHDRGIHVHVWTVDHPDEMRRLLDLGVDGMMTDRPTALRDVLVERDQWGIPDE